MSRGDGCVSDPSLTTRVGVGMGMGVGAGGRALGVGAGSAGPGGLGGASTLGGRSYPSSFTDTLLQSAGASRSSSMRSAYTTHNVLGPLLSEGTTTSTSYKSLANQTRNGSLSYDSLLTPSESPEFESAAPELSPPKPHPPPGVLSQTSAPREPQEPPPMLGYSSPFLSAQQREGSLHRACPARLSCSSRRSLLRASSPPPSSPEALASFPPAPQPSSSHSPRARSLGSPPPGSGLPSALGKSLSYTAGAAAGQRHPPLTAVAGGAQVAK